MSEDDDELEGESLANFIARLEAATGTERIRIPKEYLDKYGNMYLPPQAFYLVDSAGGIHEAVDTYGRIKMATAIELDDTDGIAGNATHTLGIGVEEIWEIRSISLTSNAGATYDIQDDGVVVSAGVAIAASDTAELITVAAIPVAGASLIGITSGVVADTWNIRAIRIL